MSHKNWLAAYLVGGSTPICRVISQITWLIRNLADSGDDELEERANYRLQESTGQIDTEESLL